MCGICGVLHLRHEVPATEGLIATMVATLRHRGPDESGVFLDRGFGMGAARLSIIDLANGSQPMASADRRLVAALNGEIYNHQELRDSFDTTHPFRSLSDSE